MLPNSKANFLGLVTFLLCTCSLAAYGAIELHIDIGTEEMYLLGADSGAPSGPQDLDPNRVNWQEAGFAPFNVQGVGILIDGFAPTSGPSRLNLSVSQSSESLFLGAFNETQALVDLQANGDRVSYAFMLPAVKTILAASDGAILELNDGTGFAPITVIVEGTLPVVHTAACLDDPTVNCVTGIDGLTILGETYDVEFVLDSYNVVYAAGDPLFLANPAGEVGPGSPPFEALNAVAAALNKVDDLFGVIGRGSSRSMIQLPSRDFGGDLASNIISLCFPDPVTGCGPWGINASVVADKNVVTNGPEIFGPYARFRLTGQVPVFGQCANPVQLADIMDNLAIGFSTDPGEPQPDIVLATQREPVRGYVHPEGGDVGAVQCDTDYILHYVFLGAGGATLEERLQRLADFRGDFTAIDFLIDGNPVDGSEIFETAAQDGFNPNSANPMAFLFVSWISEPRSLSTGMHESRIDLTWVFDPVPFELVSNFEVISVDIDGDGIEDGIDGTFDGAFEDQSAVFSNDFTDQHRGGTTHGSIFVRGDNNVTVTDEGVDGVVLASTGSGFSVVQMCGPANFDIFNVLLVDSKEIAVTCGSLTAEVLSGPVTIAVGVNVEITIPAGAKAFMKQLPGSLVSITNLSGPGGPDIVVEDDNGTTPVGPDDPPLITEVDDGSIAAPDDVAGRAKRGKVNLTWTPVDEAEGYDVHRARQSGGPYDLVSSVAGNVFVDTDVITGETYFYVVQSVANGHRSDNSNEAEVLVPARRRR